MAIIGRIRNKMGVIVAGVIGFALLLFVMGDFFPQGQGGPTSNSIGTIAGDDVDLMLFERRANREAEALRNDFGQNVDQGTQEQIRNSIWNEIIKERVLKTQVEGAGFGATLCKEEYDDIRFGNNILPDFRNQPNFQDPATGQVDPAKVKQWFTNVQTSSPDYHEINKQRIIDNRLYTKFNTLVRKSIFANKAQGKDEFEQKNLKATFNFVVKPFNAEPDSLYPVSEEDLKRYHAAHKHEKKYEQTASRTFDFVSFAVKATEPDKEAARRELAELAADFAAAENDSLFVISNSTSRSYMKVAYTAGTADAATDSILAVADTGSIVGPYLDGELWKLAKVKELADVREARVRHILIKSDASNEAEKKQRADSILAVVKRDKSKFEALVTKFSEDPASKGTGGVYEWFDKKRMVPEFTKASFEEKVGAITVCKTDYGFHIVEVLGQRDRKERRICFVDRRIEPSPATFNALYKEANTFSLDYNTVGSFKTGADTLGLEVKPVTDMKLEQRYVPGLQEPNALISWVNNAEQGEVSGPIQCGEVYVVALFKIIKETGEPGLDDVREAFTREVVKEKKAEAYKKLMVGKTDLTTLATELGLSVQTASELPLSSSSIPGGYAETELLGRIFGMSHAPEITDVSTEKKALADRVRGRAETGVMNALRDAAGVVDERGKFY